MTGFSFWAHFAAIQIFVVVGGLPSPPVDIQDEVPIRPSFKILGGKEAPAGYIPWQVSLQNKKGRHFCGGSIIAETHVITAAHCIAGKDPNSIVVVAGAHNIKNYSEITQQVNWPWKLVRHPKYIELFGMNWDSAIIHLQFPFIFNDYVKPIRLAPKNHYPSPLARCITSGWGNNNRLGVLPVLQTTPEGLQVVNTTIVPRAVCNLPYLIGSRSLITRNMICSTNGIIQGTCNGDSGGPLVCYDLRNDKEPYLAGLTSFGVPPCGHPLFPSVFSNIGSQREFIDNEVGIEEYKNTTESIFQVLQGAIHEVENIGAGLLEILPIG